MKIVHYLRCHPFGGDAIVALMLAAEQRRLGNDARIIIERHADVEAFLVRAASEGVPAVEAHASLSAGTEGMARRVAAISRSLWRAPAHVLHFHTGWLAARTAEALAARMSPHLVRLITVHAAGDWSVYPDQDQQKARWQRTARLFDHVLCPSQTAFQIQREAGIPETHIQIQYNPVSVQRLAAGKRETVRNELGLGDGDLLLLMVGRLDADKSPLELVRAFGLVVERAPQLHLAIAGSGKLDQECKHLIAELGLVDRIHLLGKRVDTHDIYKAADIYIQPSLRESFGLAMVEAMATGLPLIATRVGILREIDQIDQAAVIVDSPEPQVLAHAIIELVDSAQRRDVLAARSQQIAAQFDTPIVAQSHLDLYHRLLRTQPHVTRVKQAA